MSNHPSSIGAVGSELRVEADVGAAFGVLFGGFVLRANSLGHLEQIDSYAPGHQVRFGSLTYTADIRGDLIFDGFEPQPGAPHCRDGYDLALPPNSTQRLRPHQLRPLVRSQLRQSRTGG